VYGVDDRNRKQLMHVIVAWGGLKDSGYCIAIINFSMTCEEKDVVDSLLFQHGGH
jgi:hypothetical protein